MDVRMPNMDGYEASDAIRKLKRPDALTVPIIAMTANAFKEDVDKALAHGMNAFGKAAWLWKTIGNDHKTHSRLNSFLIFPSNEAYF